MKNLWSKILTAAVVFVCVVTEAGAALIGLYQFNDPNNLGRDTSGSGNSAINVGATFTTIGYQDGAAFFDGSAYLRSPIDPNPSALPQLTWGAWVRPLATNPIRTVISGDNLYYDRHINIDNRGGSTSWSVFTGAGVFGSGVPPSTSEWTFLAAAYNQPANSLTFYVNDQLFTTASNFGHSSSFFDIGHNPAVGEFLYGSIDNVFVYNEFLSQGQIAEIRANGFPVVIPEPSSVVLMGQGLAMGLIILLMRHRSSRKKTAA